MDAFLALDGLQDRVRRNIDLDGFVDIHTHVGPSPFDRRVDAYECAREAAEESIDAVVFKEHHLPTVYGVPFVRRLLDRDGLDVEPIGSVVLNYCNGGFNPFMVQSALDYGAGVVWGPTLDARHHAEKTGELGAFLGVEVGSEYDGREGITALDADGTLRDEVRLCIEKVADADAVLALGHLSFEELRAMTACAADYGHGAVLIDHPNYSVTDLDVAQQRELVDLGATMNYPFMALSPSYGWIDSEALAANIREVGVDNSVLSSDVGQVFNPSVPESLRLLAEALIKEGFSVQEVRQMAEHTPKRLLGIE